MKINVVFSVCLGFLLVACTSSTVSPTVPNTSTVSTVSPTQAVPTSAASQVYPIIPIPPHVSYHGWSPLGDDLTMIDFFIDPQTNPDLNAQNYAATLGPYGWTRSGGGCAIDITDTSFLGSYSYGQDPGAPSLCIGRNMMITGGDQMTIFVKNCGVMTEGRTEEQNRRGCHIVVKDQ